MTEMIKIHHHNGKTVASRDPVPNGRIRPSRPKAISGFNVRKAAVMNK